VLALIVKRSVNYFRAVDDEDLPPTIVKLRIGQKNLQGGGLPSEQWKARIVNG